MATSRPISTLFLLLLLAGCSSTSQLPEPPPVPNTSWALHQKMLLKLKNWELSGKIGIRTDANSHSASLNWRQFNGNYEIDMTGPLGQGGAHIKGRPGQVHITIAGEGEYEATSPEQLLHDTLGWEIPIQQARWWIRGLPAPDTPYLHELNNNRLATLAQDGWMIRYLRYNNEQHTLPTKIKMSRGALRITLLVKNWKTIR